MKFQYKSVIISEDHYQTKPGNGLEAWDEKWEPAEWAHLDNLGDSGWELVSTYLTDGDYVVGIFKREASSTSSD